MLALRPVVGEPPAVSAPRPPTRLLSALAGLVALVACTGPAADTTRPEPAPAPIVAPPVAPPPVAPPAVEAPSVAAAAVAASTSPRVLAWRLGPPERPSILMSVPAFPVTRQDALPDPWGEYYTRVARVAFVSSAEASAAFAARHGPGSARRDLRVLLGDDLFARFLERGTRTYGGEPDVAAIATLDPHGAALVLAAGELGYRRPDDGLEARLRSWAGAVDLPVVALLDDERATDLLEALTEADVLSMLRENLSEPERFPRWLAAARAAWASGDAEAMALACDEPERTQRWDERARRSFRDFARAIAEPTASALLEMPTLVAVDVCAVVTSGGLLELLRARDLELVPLGPAE